MQSRISQQMLHRGRGGAQASMNQPAKKVFVWWLFEQPSKVHRPRWGFSLRESCRTVPEQNIWERKALKEHGCTHVQPGRRFRKSTGAHVMICLATCMILRDSFRHLHAEPDFGSPKCHIQNLQYPACKNCKCWAEVQFPCFNCEFLVFLLKTRPSY